MGLGSIQDKAICPSKLQLILPGRLKGREKSYLFGISMITGMLGLK